MSVLSGTVSRTVCFMLVICIKKAPPPPRIYLMLMFGILLHFGLVLNILVVKCQSKKSFLLFKGQVFLVQSLVSL